MCPGVASGNRHRGQLEDLEAKAPGATSVKKQGERTTRLSKCLASPNADTSVNHTSHGRITHNFAPCSVYS